MNPGYKYPIDESVLRSKLLETTSSSMDKAWEGFEHYLSQQKPIFTESKKTRLSLMISPKLLLRGFLAGLIILPSILFYKQFNAKIPAAIHKVYAPTAAAERKATAVSNSPVRAEAQMPVSVPVSTLPKEALMLNSAPKSQNLPAKITATPAHKQSLVHLADTVFADQKAASSAGSQTVIPAPAEQVIPGSPQIEQSGELNEQL